MKIFKITCHSTCCSYSEPYLQSVTVLAETKQQAINFCKYSILGYNFIYPSNRWQIEELVSDITVPCVMNFYIGSDF